MVKMYTKIYAIVMIRKNVVQFLNDLVNFELKTNAWFSLLSGKTRYLVGTDDEVEYFLKYIS